MRSNSRTFMYLSNTNHLYTYSQEHNGVKNSCGTYKRSLFSCFKCWFALEKVFYEMCQSCLFISLYCGRHKVRLFLICALKTCLNGWNAELSVFKDKSCLRTVHWISHSLHFAPPPSLLIHFLSGHCCHGRRRMLRIIYQTEHSSDLCIWDCPEAFSSLQGVTNRGLL